MLPQKDLHVALASVVNLLEIHRALGNFISVETLPACTERQMCTKWKKSVRSWKFYRNPEKEAYETTDLGNKQ